MQSVAYRPEASNAIRNDLGAIFVSMELSRSTWLTSPWRRPKGVMRWGGDMSFEAVFAFAGAEVDLLGPRLERIAEQRPDGRHASPESAVLVARAVVIRHLLIEVAADARGNAERKVLAVQTCRHPSR